MKYLKIFETFELGTAFTEEENSDKIDVEGIEVILINLPNWIKSSDVLLYTVEMSKAGALTMYPICFDNLNNAKNYIKSFVDSDENYKDSKFVIRTLSLSKGNVSNNINTQLDTPPKWVKNPRVWAMDKIVELFTPESNIYKVATTYVESKIFDFKDLKKLESNIRAIYQSCKDKKELDVKDHVRRFKSELAKTKNKDLVNNKDKYTQVYKFENLLTYF